MNYDLITELPFPHKFVIVLACVSLGFLIYSACVRIKDKDASNACLAIGLVVGFLTYFLCIMLPEHERSAPVEITNIIKTDSYVVFILDGGYVVTERDIKYLNCTPKGYHTKKYSVFNTYIGTSFYEVKCESEVANVPK